MKLVHISAYDSHNAGDIYLSDSVKKVFGRTLGPIDWTNVSIQKEFDRSDVDFFNEHDAVVLGGGGFISVSSFHHKKKTGWNFGFPSGLLPHFKKKFIVVSLGYNLFRGEVMDDEIFTENISSVIDRSMFFSLRHNRDISKLKKIVGNKPIDLNFCTSMISDDFIFNESSDKIVFQFAWDQVVKRFGSEENADLFVDNMMEVAKSLISSGMRVLIVSHTNRDIDRSDAICSKWSSKGVKCEHISLVKSPAHEISLFYYGVNTVFAMRGHSQMIPMGLGCKIVSLISHDKVLGLIEDLSIEETGVEVLDKDFTDKCLECYNTCHATDFSKAIDKARNNININMDRIKRGLKNG